MDPFYSLVILEELGHAAGEDSLEAGLDQLGAEIRDNLSGHGYFTELHVDDQPVSFEEVSEYTVLERDGRVQFVFLLPLSQPLEFAEHTLRYQVFDPSYYLEMVHEAQDDAPAPGALVVAGDRQCDTRILPADPNPERIMEAAMLDVDDQAQPGLGRHFAETGEVTCQ
ncbi:membrane protein [Halomonas urumqiensis]|nr:membrane protein [Halomonas urumqiensis]